MLQKLRQLLGFREQESTRGATLPVGEHGEDIILRFGKLDC